MISEPNEQRNQKLDRRSRIKLKNNNPKRKKKSQDSKGKTNPLLINQSLSSRSMYADNFLNLIKKN